jgi:4-amino-4-deoxy-L-arabinose transferase-like glycosyltransferase
MRIAESIARCALLFILQRVLQGGVPPNRQDNDNFAGTLGPSKTGGTTEGRILAQLFGVEPISAGTKMRRFFQAKAELFANKIARFLPSIENRHVLALVFLAAVILFGQIQSEVLYSPDGADYALIGKDLAQKPFSEWSVLLWVQGPYYEHPPLLFWILGLSIKMFGVGTLQVILPPLLLALVSVWVTYQIGKILVGHHFGLVAGAILTLTPRFIKDSRNPMVEPALTLMILLAVLFHLKWMKTPTWRNSLFCGLFVGLALLAKGPPGLLSICTIVFISIIFLWKKGYFDFSEDVNPKKTFLHFALLLGIPILLLGAVDLWHFSQAGKSYFAHYASHQLRLTIIESRGMPANDWLYYFKKLGPYYTVWLPFLIAAPILLAIKKRTDLVAPLVVGAAIALGTVFGFSLMRVKSIWYVSPSHSGFALLSAITVCHFIRGEWVRKYFNAFVLVLVLPILFFSASFPSLFTSYRRPKRWFIAQTYKHVGNQVAGKPVADCARLLDQWRAPPFMKYYLGTHVVACDDSSTNYKFIDLRKHSFHKGEKVLFSRYPFALILRENKMD